ncbi:MAG: hypothetical protein NVS1B13_25890 [Flavisolibacter sp.]
MAKNMDYQIMKGCNHQDFIDSVKNLLNEGWELHGNLIAVPERQGSEGKEETICFIQAFVRNMAAQKPLGFSMSQ